MFSGRLRPVIWRVTRTRQRRMMIVLDRKPGASERIWQICFLDLILQVMMLALQTAGRLVHQLQGTQDVFILQVMMPALQTAGRLMYQLQVPPEESHRVVITLRVGDTT